MIPKNSFPEQNSQSAPDFAVIFDMDGVIVDSNPYHKIALRQFCRKHGRELSDEELKTRIFGRTNRDWLTEFFHGKLSEQQFREFEEEKESLFREIILPHIRPVKGLIPFLEKLRSQGVVRAVATSAPRTNVEFTLNHTATGKYFSTIIYGDMVQHSKPHPEIYLKTARAIGFEPGNCIVIEDSLSGIEAAQKAGCRVIGITTTHTGEELAHTDRVIDHFEDIRISEFGAILLKPPKLKPPEGFKPSGG